LNPGDVVSGRYLVVERLGAGGMGSVYRVEHSMMRVPMAMKVLRPELSKTEEMEKRFEREAKAAARLDSPHIVRANDFGRTPDGTLFLVMELIEGETLAQRIKRGRIELDDALEIVDQILAGLEHAHQNDVLHRDLKPGNVMLAGESSERVVVKLLDFGLAKLTSGDDSPLTQAGMVYGTARYMSPEQATSAPLDHRSDLYSAGVILYLLLAGRVPFEGSESEIMRQHLTAEPPPLDLRLGDRAREAALEDVVYTALAKSPEARFQDAASFRAALAECRSGAAPSFTEPTLIRMDSRAERATPAAPAVPAKARERSRFKLVIAGCLALALALVARSAFVSWSNAREVESFLLRGHQAADRRAWNDAYLFYENALRLDPDAVEDRELRTNTKRMLDSDRTEGQRFLELLSRLCDDSAAPLFAEVIQSSDEPKTRRLAYQGLEKLDELDRIDPVPVLIDGLDRTRAGECEIRKWYVVRLGELDDPRVLPALKKEQGRKAGFLFFKSDANGCMKQELDRLLSELEE
jgi:hypothetical protein